MRVVLVTAPAECHGAPKLLGRIRRSPCPPLGMAYLAAALEAHGHSVELLDALTLGWGPADTAQAVAATQPGVVGLSSYTMTKFMAYEVLRQVKLRLPEVVTVMGGPHATVSPESIFEESEDLDIILRGEAENGMAELVDRLEDGRSYDDVPGIMLRESAASISVGPSPEPVMDLDRIRYPARHIFDKNLYNAFLPLISYQEMPSAVLMTSRGCPWARCKFCNEGGRNSPLYRRRSPENVIGELRQLVEDDGIRFAYLYDDNFCVNMKWISTFCDLLDREAWPLSWSAFGRANTVTPEMLGRMAASRCVHLSYGFESGNQDILDLINKGITLDQGRQAVAWTREAGIEMRGFMMLGFPLETPEMSQKTIRFALELDTELMFFHPYYVLPGTALEELALQEGRFIEHDNATLYAPSYVPNTYTSITQLQRMVHSAYRRYYLRPRYIGRALRDAASLAMLKDYLRSLPLALRMMGRG